MMYIIRNTPTNLGVILVTVLWILLVVVAVLVLYVWRTYNTMVRSRNLVDEGWSGIDVQLKRRSDLVVNLVETVKGYAEKEQAIFTGIAESRAKIGSAQTRPERMQAETELGGFLSRLLMITENYPQLKASEGFQTLQAQLEGTENRIATERQRYIQAVKEYNIQIRRFPSNFIAGLAGFLPKETFEASERDKQVPKVDFGTSAPQPQSP